MVFSGSEKPSREDNFLTSSSLFLGLMLIISPDSYSWFYLKIIYKVVFVWFSGVNFTFESTEET
jgi:hypothetical protein